MTDAEQKLWSALRRRQLDGAYFRRQVSFPPYVADFACLERRLIIEVDGGQHADQQDYDARRTARLEKDGFRVVRFWNNDVLGNLQGVLEMIKVALAERPPTPTLPHKGGGSTGSFGGFARR